MKKIFLISSILIFSLVVPSVSKAAGASLYLSPQTGKVFVGSTFDVSIFVNTGGNDINAVKSDIQFDPKKVQVTNPSSGRSFISVWVAQPSFSNIQGQVSFQGGVPSPGVNTSSGLVSTITFRAIAPGETVISILNSSQVLLDDGKGTNVLSSIGQGVYEIVMPPPEGPRVFSPAHPDQNKWYNNSSPSFSWEKEDGVTDFSYTIDNSFYSVPDDIAEGDHTSVSYTGLDDGVWYFHIKAKKAGAWGGVTHYVLLIDTAPPAAFTLSFEPKLRSPVMVSKKPIVSFITTDGLSGISHYELKLIDLTKAPGEETTKFFIEASSPYQLPIMESGEYEVLVRAFDQAMNYQDASQKIEVIPVEKLLYFTKKGIVVWTFFIPWKVLILIFLFLIIVISIIAFWWWRRQKNLRQKREVLKAIEERARQNGEEIKQRLGGI